MLYCSAADLQTLAEEVGDGVGHITVAGGQALHHGVVLEGGEQRGPLLLADVLQVVEVDVLQLGVVGGGLLDNLVYVGVVGGFSRVHLHTNINTIKGS